MANPTPPTSPTADVVADGSGTPIPTPSVAPSPAIPGGVIPTPGSAPTAAGQTGPDETSTTGLKPRGARKAKTVDGVTFECEAYPQLSVVLPDGKTQVQFIEGEPRSVKHSATKVRVGYFTTSDPEVIGHLEDLDGSLDISRSS